jgi:hypothetical protein
VDVVDHDDDRGSGLEHAEQLQQPAADRHRVARRRPGEATGYRQAGAGPRRRPRELVDHPVLQQGLGLLAAGPQHRRRRVAAVFVAAVLLEEVRDQCGLPDPGRSLDQDHLGGTLARRREPPAQCGQLELPADEGVHAVPGGWGVLGRCRPAGPSW